MNDDLDPVEHGIVERLAAADALAEAHAHYTAKRRWYRHLLDGRTAIVVLVVVAIIFLAYSVLVNQQAISRSDAQARQAKAQATAAAQGQLAAVQLVCTLERDLRANSTRLSARQRDELTRYDRELKCSDALKKPHQPIVLPSPKSRSAPGGGQGGVQTSPSHPRPHPAPSPTPAPSSSRSATPAPRPSRTPTSTPAPTTTPVPVPTCLLKNPLTGQCLVPGASAGAGPRLPPAVLPPAPRDVILLGLGCIEWRAGEAQPAVRLPEVCVHLPLAHVPAVHGAYVAAGLAVGHPYRLW